MHVSNVPVRRVRATLPRRSRPVDPEGRGREHIVWTMSLQRCVRIATRRVNSSDGAAPEDGPPSGFQQQHSRCTDLAGRTQPNIDGDTPLDSARRCNCYKMVAALEKVEDQQKLTELLAPHIQRLEQLREERESSISCG